MYLSQPLLYPLKEQEPPGNPGGFSSKKRGIDIVAFHKMNVLHVVPYINLSAGGPSVAVRNFAKNSGEYGWQARIVTTRMFYDSKEHNLEKSLRKENLSVRIIRAGRWRPLLALERRTLEREIQEADVVHLHTLWTPLTAYTRSICSKLAKPYILMPHGMLSSYSLRRKGIRKRIYYRLIEKYNVEQARCLMFTSRYEQELAAEAFPGLPRGTVVPLGAGESVVRDRAELAESFRNKYPIVAGKRIILFLSRIHPVKGLDRLLGNFQSILATHPNAMLVVVGGGDNRYVKQLINTVSDKNLEHAVVFTGPLMSESKWEAYAAAEVFVLPSRHENFGLVVAEAMHMGLPVIVTDKVGVSPYIVEHDAGIVLEDEEFGPALASTVANLMNDPNQAAKMGENGRAVTKSELNWMTAASRLTACYEEIYRENK